MRCALPPGGPCCGPPALRHYNASMHVSLGAAAPRQCSGASRAPASFNAKVLNERLKLGWAQRAGAPAAAPRARPPAQHLCRRVVHHVLHLLEVQLVAQSARHLCTWAGGRAVSGRRAEQAMHRCWLRPSRSPHLLKGVDGDGAAACSQRGKAGVNLLGRGVEGRQLLGLLAPWAPFVSGRCLGGGSG